MCLFSLVDRGLPRPADIVKNGFEVSVNKEPMLHALLFATR